MKHHTPKTDSLKALARRSVSALVLVAATSLGCAEQHPYVWVNELPHAADAPSVTIEPRDTLLVTVKNQPTMSGEFVVRDDGGFMQPTVGNVAAAGRPPDAVAADVAARLKDMVVMPEVTVSILKIAAIRVDVVGEVKTPGAYELTRDRSVIGALAAAGWLTDFAHRDRIFVVRGGDQRIRFQAAALTGAEVHASRFKLHDGDVVVVE